MDFILLRESFQISVVLIFRIKINNLLLLFLSFFPFFLKKKPLKCSNSNCQTFPQLEHSKCSSAVRYQLFSLQQLSLTSPGTRAHLSRFMNQQVPTMSAWLCPQQNCPSSCPLLFVPCFHLSFASFLICCTPPGLATIFL